MDPKVFDELLDKLLNISDSRWITRLDKKFWLKLAEISSTDIENTFTKVVNGKRRLDDFRIFLRQMTQDKQIDDSQKLSILLAAVEAEVELIFEETVHQYLHQKLPERICTVGVHTVPYFIVNEAIDCLLESPWAKEDKNGVVRFPNRATTIKFLERSLGLEFRWTFEKDPTQKKVGKDEGSDKTDERELLQAYSTMYKEISILMGQKLKQMFLDDNKSPIWTAVICTPTTNWFAKLLPNVTGAILILTFLLWLTVFACFLALSIFLNELSVIAFVAGLLFIFTFHLWLEVMAYVPQSNICLTVGVKVTSIFFCILAPGAMFLICAFIIGPDTARIVIFILVCLLILDLPHLTAMFDQFDTYSVYLRPDEIEVYREFEYLNQNSNDNIGEVQDTSDVSEEDQHDKDLDIINTNDDNESHSMETP